MIIHGDPLFADLASASQLSAKDFADRILDVEGTEREVFELLQETGILSQTECYQIWADRLGLPFHDLDESQLDLELLAAIPYDLAIEYRAIAVHEALGVLHIVLDDPLDIIAIDAIQDATERAVQVAVATPEAIARVLHRLQRENTGIGGIISQVEKHEIAEEEIQDGDKLRAVAGEDAVIELVDYVLEESVRLRASDVHFEPLRDELRIRIRIDGSLEVLKRLPRGLHASVTTRLKVLGDLDLAETRRPLDGRFEVCDGVEARVSTIPSVQGEKIEIRLLDEHNLVTDTTALGMTEANLKQYHHGFTRPDGLVLLTGPTGCGKTTTLHATLSELNREDLHILTIEDPVEYELAGATQIQVDPRAERTFASALRAMLRQDPDILMIGEIRDEETAAISVQAALTGHLVLSTLHTNSAAAAVHRLLDMDVDAYLLAPVLRCVVAQRLLPRVCPDCAVPDYPPFDILIALDAGSKGSTFRTGQGCRQCRGRGVRGRQAVHEVLHIGDEIRRMIVAGASVDDLEHAAREGGFQPLRKDAVVKAQAGSLRIVDVGLL